MARLRTRRPGTRWLAPLLATLLALSTLLSGCADDGEGEASATGSGEIVTRATQQEVMPQVRLNADIRLSGEGDEGDGEWVDVNLFIESCENELKRWGDASEHRGVTPTEDPVNGFFYSAEVGSSDWPDYWCSEFIGWNLQKAGLVRGQTMAEEPSSCDAHYEFFSAHPELCEMHDNDGSYQPRDGDIVLCYSGGYCHTEMVDKAHGNTWEFISGGSSVGSGTRNLSDTYYRTFVTVKWNEGPLEGIGIRREFRKKDSEVGTASDDPRRDAAVKAAKSQLGVPYIWGVCEPGTGFDCNGLTYWSWKQAGVDIEYPSGCHGYGQYDQAKASGKMKYNKEDLLPGDVIFFLTSPDNPEHVGMYIGDGQIIHATIGSYGGHGYCVLTMPIDGWGAWGSYGGTPCCGWSPI